MTSDGQSSDAGPGTGIDRRLGRFWIAIKILALALALVALAGIVDLFGSDDLIYPGFWRFMGDLVTSPAAGAFAALIAAALVWEQSQAKRDDEKTEAEKKRSDEAKAAKEERWWRALENVTALKNEDGTMPVSPLNALLAQLDPAVDHERIEITEYLIARSTVSLEAQNHALQTEVDKARETTLMLGIQLGEDQETQIVQRREFLRHLKTRQAELQLSVALGQETHDSAAAAATVALQKAQEAESAINTDDLNQAAANATARRMWRSASRAEERHKEIGARLEAERRELDFLNVFIPRLAEGTSERPAPPAA